MTYEEQYATQLQRLARKARKSGNPTVCQLWNPKRKWTVDKYGGRVADEKTLQCRAEIVRILRQLGPLTANQLYNQLVGFGQRRRWSAKDYLVTAGEIVPLKEEGRKFPRYAVGGAVVEAKIGRAG